MGPRRGVLLLAVALPLFGQFDPKAPLKPEVLLLARVRLAADNNFRRLPNYTCTMTVERSQRPPRSGRFFLVDNLRLEVALVGGKELYSWPGAKQFEEQELPDMVGGNIGTGDFALHARAVLLGGATILTFVGQEQIDGREMLRWDYKVERNSSTYFMRIAPAEARVGFSGSLWADAKSYDLWRLDLVVDDVPPELPMRRGVQWIEYARQTIGSEPFLLPVAASTEFELSDGLVNRNRTTFSNCRQFAGESTLRFDDVPEASPAPAATIDWKLPPGLQIELRLVGKLNLRRAAVGDIVEFEVAKDARLKGQVWLEKGARVKARILEARCIQLPAAACGVALEPSEFTAGNKSGTLKATLIHPLILDQAASGLFGGQGVAAEMVRRLTTRTESAGLMMVRGGEVASGHASTWRTLGNRE